MVDAGIGFRESCRHVTRGENDILECRGPFTTPSTCADATGCGKSPHFVTTHPCLILAAWTHEIELGTNTDIMHKRGLAGTASAWWGAEAGEAWGPRTGNRMGVWKELASLFSSMELERPFPRTHIFSLPSVALQS